MSAIHLVSSYKIKDIDSKWVFTWSITTFLSVLTSSTVMYYALFLAQIIIILSRKEKLSVKCLLLLTYSCLLPNNYIPIIFSLIASIYLFIGRSSYVCKKSILLLLLACLSFCVSAFVNSIATTNLLFSLIYIFPSILFLIVIKNQLDKSFYKDINKAINSVFWILFFATLANLVGKCIGIPRVIPGDDWSTGTFGDGQGNPFFLIISFIVLMKFSCKNEKDRNRFLYISCGIFMLISTHSYILTMVLGVSLLISLIVTYDLSKKKWIMIITISIVCFITLHLRGFDALLVESLLNWDKLLILFPKIEIIYTAFFIIPITSFTTFLFGVGPGMFSSRAAATCTGLYISSYSKWFKPSVSIWTKEFVYKYIYNGYINSGGSDGSILRLPYSTISSIIAEYGIIGCLVMIFILYNLLRKTNKNSIYISCFFILASFFDNWLEYIKVVTFLGLTLIMCSKERVS